MDEAVGTFTPEWNLLTRAPISLLQSGYIRELQPLVLSLAEIVDGFIFAYFLDKQGVFRGCQDGATVVDVRGDFRGCMVMLRPQPGTDAEVKPRIGARHTSAAKISAETGSLAVVVSQDGHISIYDRGRHVIEA